MYPIDALLEYVITELSDDRLAQRDCCDWSTELPIDSEAYQ